MTLKLLGNITPKRLGFVGVQVMVGILILIAYTQRFLNIGKMIGSIGALIKESPRQSIILANADVMEKLAIMDAMARQVIMEKLPLYHV